MVLLLGACPQKPGEVSVRVDAATTLGSANRLVFGSSLDRLTTPDPGERPVNLTEPGLIGTVKELGPTFITIDNNGFGLPFYREGTGAQRQSILTTLERIGLPADPVGQALYQRIIDMPSADRAAYERPPHSNYDDVLRVFEGLDERPEISLRIPMAFTDLSGEWVDKGLWVDLPSTTGAELVHYLNDPETTELGRLRATNGHPAPYGVKRFVLGNEYWINHRAGISIEQLARQYIAYSTAMKQADPSVQLGIALLTDGFPREYISPAVLATIQDWTTYNERLLAALEGKADLDFVTFHDYGIYGRHDVGAADGVFRRAPLGDEDWRFLLALTHLRERHGVTERLQGIASQYTRRKLDLIIDEYTGPLLFQGGAVYNADYLLYLLRHGYARGSNWTLFPFDARADAPANLFALIRVDETGGAPSYLRRPHFLAQQMVADCVRGDLTQVDVSSTTFNTRPTAWSYFEWPAVTEVPSLSALAAVEGTRTCLVLVNRETSRSLNATITLDGLGGASEARLRTLAGTGPNDTNETKSDAVRVVETTLAPDPVLRVSLPAASVSTLTFK